MKNRRAIYIGTFLLLLPLLSSVIASAQTTSQSFPEILRDAESKTAAKDWKEAAVLWHRVIEANPVNAGF